MLSNGTAIRAENLSKLYRISGPRARYQTLRETLTNSALLSFRSLTSARGQGLNHDVWALKDVSFDVAEGEVLGIIGRNGAGKTTLLKVLSRITKPTRGRAELRGRIGALLEVGTGFHPELTGRENVFLNGAVLGMTRREMRAKFDEIVSFAEVEQFIDTPLKRYSTGMATRLAFAIAAHLEPEILAVDEVLSVGDMAFRKKCMGKMQSISAQGRTVLFVSHEMTAVRRLCQTGLWLDQGTVRAYGRIDDVISQYEKSALQSAAARPCCVQRDNPPNSPKRFLSAALSSMDGHPASAFRLGDSLALTVGMSGAAPAPTHFVEWFINEPDHGNRVAWGGTYSMANIEAPRDCKEISFRIGPLPLTEGAYSISLAMGVPGVIDLDFWPDAIHFEISQCVPEGTRNNYSTRYAPTYIPYAVTIAEERK